MTDSRTTPAHVAGARWIPLTQGKFALVDEADAGSLSSVRWQAHLRRNHWYAWRHAGQMHRLLLGVPRGAREVVDHINGDTLDNRRANLRICSISQNLFNRGPTRLNSSGLKGIWLCRQTNRWAARIQAGTKRIWLGRFDTATEAANAYDAAAARFHGEFASVNGRSS